MCFFVVASVLASLSKTCCVNIHSLYLEYCFLVGSGLLISTVCLSLIYLLKIEERNVMLYYFHDLNSCVTSCLFNSLTFVISNVNFPALHMNWITLNLAVRSAIVVYYTYLVLPEFSRYKVMSSVCQLRSQNSC